MQIGVVFGVVRDGDEVLGGLHIQGREVDAGNTFAIHQQHVSGFGLPSHPLAVPTQDLHGKLGCRRIVPSDDAVIGSKPNAGNAALAQGRGWRQRRSALADVQGRGRVGIADRAARRVGDGVQRP